MSDESQPKPPTPSRPAQETANRRVEAPGDHLCAITDVGRIRDHNEDAFFVSLRGPLLVVADGLGGHQAGEVASALAVAMVAETFDNPKAPIPETPTEEIGPLLLDVFQRTQREILERGIARPDWAGMGTTLVVGLIRRDGIDICHVGDSRCYVLHAGALQQITRDHSLVGDLVAAGLLTSEQARVHPRKNELLQAIGLPSGVAPDLHRARLESDDLVLLCSDGLWESLSDEEIVETLRWEASIRQRATRLVDRANARGGYDNTTVVLYQHRGRR